MDALARIAAQAKRHSATIVLPEGGDARVVAAATEAARRGLAEVVLLGDESATACGVRVMDARAETDVDKHAEVLTRALAHKGMTTERAMDAVRAPLTRAMCMVACGDADGCVAGAVHTTADVLGAALRIVGAKTSDDDCDKSNDRDDANDNDNDSSNDSDSDSNATNLPANNLVSSFFIMLHNHPHQALRGAAVFADCALVVEPDASQLARIAIDSADSATALIGLAPRVALLSFSTAGSARHPQVDKVRRAGEIVAAARPDIELLAEVQFDAAVIPEILQRKAPDIGVAAPANIFIFPDLQSANIGYKIAERIGAATAVGPILQGMRRPVNDLSRGCAVDDIVSLIAVTAVQAQAA